MEKGFLLTTTYRIEDGVPKVYLYGRLESGTPFISRHAYLPYFFIRKADEEAFRPIAKDAGLETEGSDLRTFQDDPVMKVTARVPKDIPEIRRQAEKSGIPCYEADIRFTTRFLIDRRLLPLIAFEGESSERDGCRFYDEPRLSPQVTTEDVVDPRTLPELRVLSLDIEADDHDRLFCMAFAMGKKEATILVAQRPMEPPLPHTIVARNETEALEKATELIRGWDPDIITGWNVIDFDLAFLARKYAALQLPFAWGRDASQLKVKLESQFLRDSRVDVSGRIVLDGIHILKSSFVRLEDYKLGTAAEEILGDEKLIGEDDKLEEIKDSYLHDQK